jgi:hypothetical protein
LIADLLTTNAKVAAVAVLVTHGDEEVVLSVSKVNAELVASLPKLTYTFAVGLSIALLSMILARTWTVPAGQVNRHESTAAKDGTATLAKVPDTTTASAVKDATTPASRVKAITIIFNVLNIMMPFSHRHKKRRLSII